MGGCRLLERGIYKHDMPLRRRRARRTFCSAATVRSLAPLKRGFQLMPNALEDSSYDAEQDRLAAARVGQFLSERWRLDSLIGVGGMASVYAATHRNGK